jgi:hypothetical protein
MSTTHTKCCFNEQEHEELTKASIDWVISKGVKPEHVKQYLGKILERYNVSKSQSINSLYYNWKKIPFVKSKGTSFRPITVQKLLERTIGFNPCSENSIKDNKRLQIFNNEITRRTGIKYTKPYKKTTTRSYTINNEVVVPKPVTSDKFQQALFNIYKQDQTMLNAFLEKQQQSYIEFCIKY